MQKERREHARQVEDARRQTQQGPTPAPNPADIPGTRVGTPAKGR